MPAGDGKAALAAALHGEIGRLAKPKVAYQIYREIFGKASASARSPGRVPTRSASCGPVPAPRTLRTRT